MSGYGFGGMGYMAATEEQFTCDGCDATVTCPDRDLYRVWRWQRRSSKSKDNPWTLLLCDTCNVPRK